MTTKLTAAAISQWIDNDEGLYLWHRRSKLTRRAFIRENRAELEKCIHSVLDGKKPSHDLAYPGR
jgi:hypothetical protein